MKKRESSHKKIKDYAPKRENLEQVLEDKRDGTCWSCRKLLKDHSYEELRKCYARAFTFKGSD